MVSLAYPGPRSVRLSVRLLALLVFSLLCLAVTAAGAYAQSREQLTRFTRSYVTPFPEGDRYRLYVFGDSLGDGIWAGLYRAFQSDDNVEVVKKSKVSTGFVRVDRFDWNEHIRDITSSEKFHIAVVMVGANDMQPIRHDGEWHEVGSEGWREIYGRRIDRFIKTLKESHAALYWVGLPIMRSEKHNAAMQVMNEIFREKAFVNGVKFVDTWNGFADQFGRYSAYGPDLSGQVRQLRADDGVHFTMKGYRKLAHFVEREIRRDLRKAENERDVPLAGDESEQARAISGGASAESDASPAARRGSPSAGAVEKRRRQEQTEAAPESGAAEIEPAFEKNRKTVAGIEIVRPGLDDAVLAASGDDYAPEGETVAGELDGGLTALASVSPINDPTLSSPQRLPLTQRPYYRVFVRGERLTPKTGRADDFSWPGS